jgi:hypothetical protein
MDRYAEHPLSATPISRCLFLLITIAMAGSTLHRATSAELDRAGRIAWIGHPMAIEDEMIEDLLR